MTVLYINFNTLLNFTAKSEMAVCRKGKICIITGSNESPHGQQDVQLSTISMKVFMLNKLYNTRMISNESLHAQQVVQYQVKQFPYLIIIIICNLLELQWNDASGFRRAVAWS